MPRADFRPGTDLGGSVPMSAEQADRMREASMELHDATMMAGGPMGAEAGTGAVALASRRTPINLPPPSRGLINATGEEPGFTAYHGSPHLFPPTERNPLGEFDPMKIGTGEGSQAFGVGAGYLGEAENTAKYYRDRYGPQADPKVQAAGAEFNAAHAAFDGSETARARVDAAERALQDAEANAPPGHMYEVKVNARPEHFLDWDRPLSEQSPHVQAALGKLGPVSSSQPIGAQLNRAYNNPMYGGDLIGKDSATPIEVSQALQDAGIAGIRYLDAGSRGAGEGSRNLVVFSPETMNIIRRYGIAGLMAGAGAAAGTQDQTQ
jgi:hypothetical protein